jgi:hypothetical protein
MMMHGLANFKLGKSDRNQVLCDSFESSVLHLDFELWRSGDVMDHFRNKNAFDVLSNICRAYYIGLCKMLCLFF